VNNLVKDTSVKAVEVMVAKHLQGDNSVSKDEVKQVINDQLNPQCRMWLNQKTIPSKAKNAVDGRAGRRETCPGCQRSLSTPAVPRLCQTK